MTNNVASAHKRKRGESSADADISSASSDADHVAQTLDKVRVIVDDIQTKMNQHQLYVNGQLAAILYVMTGLQNRPITRQIAQQSKRVNTTVIDEMEVDTQVFIKQEATEETGIISSPLTRRNDGIRPMYDSFTSATITLSPHNLVDRFREFQNSDGHTNNPASLDIPYAPDNDEEEEEVTKEETHDEEDGSGYTPPRGAFTHRQLRHVSLSTPADSRTPLAAAEDESSDSEDFILGRPSAHSRNAKTSTPVDHSSSTIPDNTPSTPQASSSTPTAAPPSTRRRRPAPGALSVVRMSAKSFSDEEISPSQAAALSNATRADDIEAADGYTPHSRSKSAPRGSKSATSGRSRGTGRPGSALKMSSRVMPKRSVGLGATKEASTNESPSPMVIAGQSEVLGVTPRVANAIAGPSRSNINTPDRNINTPGHRRASTNNTPTCRRTSTSTTNKTANSSNDTSEEDEDSGAVKEEPWKPQSFIPEITTWIPTQTKQNNLNKFLGIPSLIPSNDEQDKNQEKQHPRGEGD